MSQLYRKREDRVVWRRKDDWKSNCLNVGVGREKERQIDRVGARESERVREREREGGDDEG